MKNILIIGDIMIDKYINVQITKIANESPIPVFSLRNKKYILGGCGNVLQNMKLFNNNLYLISVIGNDKYGSKLIGLLNDNNTHNTNVNTNFIIDNTRRTTVKIRIICDNKILLRYDSEDTFIINNEIQDKIINSFDLIFDQIDIVIFSDYNKGVLTERICKYIINKCNENNKITIGDLKHHFNYYKNITITKPNLSEAKYYTKCDSIIDMHKYIINNINCKHSIITIGKDGISLYNEDDNIPKIYIALYESNEVIDVTGAGDIVTAVIGSLYNQHLDIKVILNIATYLGTLSVKKIGTYEINQSDIINAYKWVKNKDLSKNSLYHIKKSNLKIVFTNGCFDILHIGHITYLEEAKKLGDILIIGLNDDDSIKRLKGTNRPINNLKDRITFLSKFDFIDFIIPFSEDTPLDLIKEINPDILIKGGDYKIEDIIGREYAKETIVLPFVEEKSTTNIINKLKN
jgi:D-beta-D-heptose 7-phosphate kinase/D-beta-D-heptose 1-phosphate adenosyltransferase